MSEPTRVEFGRLEFERVEFERLEVEVTVELHAVETRVDPADIEAPEALAYEVRLRSLHDAVEGIAAHRAVRTGLRSLDS